MTIIYIILSIYCFISIESVHLSSCAKWNKTGKTIAGNNFPGNGSNQLNLPQGMFYHRETNALFVADTGNRRIQMFSLDASSITGITVASNIDSISSIYVDDDGTTMYITLRYENRLEKWIKFASTGEQIGDQCKQCASVFLDKEKNIYMTETGAHTVRKWIIQTNTSQIIAGQIDQQGQSANHLYFPRGIYVNRKNNALYVSDAMNNRIQLWNKDSLEGKTVAGSEKGISGYDNSKLANPIYVWVDEESDIIYIVDSDNHRIQRWLPNKSIGDAIAGASGQGNGTDQLSLPNSLAFDNFGNLYVCDGKNHRIQMFLLIDNQTCPSSHSNSLFIQTTKTIKTNIFMFLLSIILFQTKSE